jgi:hypothetical protein
MSAVRRGPGRAPPRSVHLAVSRQRHERFRHAYAVVRIDEYLGTEIPREDLITVKAVWLEREQAERDAARLNALSAAKGTHYFVQHTRVERDA